LNSNILLRSAASVEGLITPPEMAAKLRVSLRSLANFKDRRLIPHIKLGRAVRYDEHAVMRALEKLTVKEVA
jgi:hypothetical protein